MRIVLDTNVFISGIFFTGPPSQILTAWKDNELQIILSQDILDEYLRVAQALSSKYPRIDILQIIELFVVHAQFVDTKKLQISVCEDPDDNKFLECAMASNTPIIVSGDKHLLRVTGYEGIAVLRPKKFADRYLN